MAENNDSPQAPMTRPQQPKEYIIEAPLLEEIKKKRLVPQSWIQMIEARPVTSATARERPKYPQTCDMSKWTPEEIANRLQCAYDKGVREAQQPPAPAAAALQVLEKFALETDNLLLQNCVRICKDYAEIAALRERGEQHE